MGAIGTQHPKKLDSSGLHYEQRNSTLCVEVFKMEIILHKRVAQRPNQILHPWIHQFAVILCRIQMPPWFSKIDFLWSAQSLKGLPAGGSGEIQTEFSTPSNT